MIAIVGTVLIGLFFGAIAARSTGIYFLMITLTFSVIGFYFVGQVTVISGFSGIGGINRYTPGFIGDMVNDRYRLFYIALGVALFVYAVIRFVVRTPFGLSLQGVRDEPVRMSSLGYAVPLHRTLAFGLAAFFAALSGVLLVWWQGQVAPGDVGLPATIDLLVVAVIGGLARIEGAWVGALAFILIGNYIRDSWLTRVARRPAHRRQLQHDHRAHLPADRDRLARWARGPLGQALGAHPGWGRLRRNRGTRHTRGRGPPRSVKREEEWSNLVIDSFVSPTQVQFPPRRATGMSRISRHWKLLLPLGVLVVLASVVVSTSFAASKAKTVKVAIMTDCKGAFGFGYELDIGGAQAAFANYANGKVKDPKKPSAGMTGIRVGTTPVQIVGYGCGDDTVPTAVKETRRLMEQLDADVMIGPLSGDEAVYVARYAKAHPNKTFIIGTAGSQDPTLQIAPKNLFRYHADGAQWNAGIGELAYKKLGWRNAAIMMDDYSFGWTSGAGIIADFCAVGGKITKRVFPPLNTTDYSSYVQQLGGPSKVDGTFWVVGGTGTSASLTAYEQAYGALDPSKHIGNLFFAFLGADKVVAPKMVGSYVGGSGTGPGLKSRAGEDVREGHQAVVSGAARRGPLPLQLLQRRVGDGPGSHGLEGCDGSGASGRDAEDPQVPATRSPTAARSSSTRGVRRSVTSTSCSSSRTRTARSARRWSRTCRVSIRRSAACSSRRARPPAGPSLRARS